MNFPKSGNNIWFNRAFLYYHRVDNDPEFVGEMYWIMKKAEIIPEYKPKSKETEGNIDNT